MHTHPECYSCVMAKPEARPLVTVKPAIRTHAPAKRPIAVRLGNNQWRVVLETYDCAPTSTEVLAENTTTTDAQYLVRIWHENNLGPNREADSGL